MSSRVLLAVPLALMAAGLALASDAAGNKDAGKGTVSHLPRVRLGGIQIGAGYSHFSGPAYYSGYGYGPWGPWGAYGLDPFFYGGYLHPGFFDGYRYGPSMGEIKLRSDNRDAWVYLDGALAGKAEKLKTMWLEPGAYNLEVRSGDKRFGQRVYVLSGKTLRLTADLARSEVRP